MRPALAAGILLAATSAFAQPAPGAAGPRRAAARDEAFRMVDAYLVSTLQESLGLTDEQFVRMVPLVKRLQADRRAIVQRRITTLQELRRTLEAGGATEARVGDLLREVKAVEAEEPAVLRRNMEAIDAALTPLQQAKFRILSVEVEQKIRELMSRVRQDRRRPDGPLR